MTTADLVLVLSLIGGVLTGLKVLLDSIQERRSAQFKDAHELTDIAAALVTELKAERDQYKAERDTCCEALATLQRRLSAADTPQT